MNNDIKFFWRSLGRNRVHSFITIGGFAMSMAVVLILTAHIMSERSYNKNFPNIDRMYLVVREDNSPKIDERVIQSLSSTIPEVERATSWQAHESNISGGGNEVAGRMLFTDEHFMDIFSVKLLSGNPESLKEPGLVFITTELSKKLFGEENPIGQSLGMFQLRTIGGIIEAPSPYSGIQYDALLMENSPLGQDREYLLDGQIINMERGVVLLRDNVDLDLVRNKFSALSTYIRTARETKEHLDIRPFRDTYFDTTVSDDSLLHGNVSLMRLLTYVTILILALALLNYISLTTVRGMERLREVGIRKAVGAERRSIISQLLKETYIICFISLLLGYGLSILVKPVFEAILGETVHLSWLYSKISGIVLVLGAFMLTGLLAGLLPALSASKLKPVSLLGSRAPSARGFEIRGLLSVLQFSTAIALMIFLMFLMKQVDYVKNTSLGFDQEQVLRIDLPPDTREMRRDLINELLTLPGVEQVSLSQGGPGWGVTPFGGLHPDGVQHLESSRIFSDTAFLSTFGIKLIKGRDFTMTDKNALLINQTLYNQLGGGELEDLWRFMGSEVVGVMEDFHFKDLYQPIGGLSIQMDANEIRFVRINVRLSPQYTIETLELLRQRFQVRYGERFPDYPFGFLFYDDLFDSLYGQDENQAAAVRIFSVLAILLSCMGLFGLAGFQANRKVKEIGIRKVNGARVGDVMILLNRHFMLWVAISFVIAIPVSWYLTHQWLQRFAYRTELSWWVFALAGLLALIIAMLTVSGQSWKAATRNPVESLRYE